VIARLAANDLGFGLVDGIYLKSVGVRMVGRGDMLNSELLNTLRRIRKSLLLFEKFLKRNFDMGDPERMNMFSVDMAFHLLDPLSVVNQRRGRQARVIDGATKAKRGRHER
jgi:hypothetical protein